MMALWRTDPRLAMLLEAIPEEEIPSVEPAKDGNFTVRAGAAGGGGAGVYLHSRYRPVQEAQAWAAAQKIEEGGGRYAVVVSGFGLGYHLQALFDRMPEDAVLVVGEPNLALIRAALGAVDLSEMLASGRVMIFTSLDRGVLVDRLEPRSVLFTAGAGTLLVSHPASVQVEGAFHRAFQKLITEFIAFTRTGFLTLMLNNVTTCRNVANNLGRYATTPPIDLMRDVFKGKPAVLVAAGPSLAKNMHLLKELVGEKPEARGEKSAGGDGGAAPRKAVIIAVQTMLKPLLAAGIEPDFVTSLDYNTVSTRFFENLEESGSGGHVHLVAEAKANWNVLDVFSAGGGAAGRGSMSVLQNDFAERLLRGAFPGPMRAGLKAGATVAHLSFYLAEYLGCDPLIMVGQDLGFVDGLYYKPGTAIHETWGVELGRFNTLETKEWERIARSRAILRKIPDIHGHPMYTEEQFFVYLQQFERDFAASRCRVIDATEGGARKGGVTVMTLREAIDRYCSGQEAVVSGQREKATAWKVWSCDAVGNLRRVRAALEARQRAAAGMKETCELTVPILKEMLEHQKDDARMNKLFVEVDRLRGKVGEDPATFEMVTHLNTIGELRRYQADLLVKKSARDPLERQRRQLTRDIEYVTDLQVGAERLLEILGDALRRIDRQIEALAAGKPWPREVAGA
jgi:hypothetical protein